MEVQLTDANFKAEVLESKIPVIVDFWAPWCGPCKMMLPILEEVAKEFEGRLKVAKMNVDENPKTPGEYGVLSIPMFLIVKNGAVSDQVIGAIPKASLVAKVENALGE